MSSGNGTNTKRGLAEMLRGGVIMDVVNAEKVKKFEAAKRTRSRVARRRERSG